MEDLVVSLARRRKRRWQAGQVRVAVRAAGVNFRDVLIALGMYPGRGRGVGGEGAGVVVEVGPGVAGVGVGDRVMGLVSGAVRPDGGDRSAAGGRAAARGGRSRRPRGCRWCF